MDEFVVLLIVAVVAIGGLMLIGTPLANWATGNWTSTGNFRLLSSFDLGRVGLSGNESSRTVNLGSFMLGETQTDVLKDMATLGVSQGYFGADPKKFDMPVSANILATLKDVKISFNIEESNLYGNLVFKWNDKVVFDKMANLRSYEIVIPAADVKASNTLDIVCGTPGLYFWAATSYKLIGFKAIAEYGPEKFLSFALYPQEIEAWSKGTLRFSTPGQAGEITIKLNGYEIYRSSNPERQVTKEFTYSDIGGALRVGDNVLSLKSTSAFAIDNLQFEIGGPSGAKEREVNATKDDVALLNGAGRGEIEFNVDSILKEGALTIKINGKQINVQAVTTGKNTVQFDSGEIVEGRNTIAFAGTGSWSISGVKVRIVY